MLHSVIKCLLISRSSYLTCATPRSPGRCRRSGRRRRARSPVTISLIAVTGLIVTGSPVTIRLIAYYYQYRLPVTGYFRRGASAPLRAPGARGGRRRREGGGLPERPAAPGAPRGLPDGGRQGRRRRATPGRRRPRRGGRRRRLRHGGCWDGWTTCMSLHPALKTCKPWRARSVTLVVLQV